MTVHDLCAACRWHQLRTWNHCQRIRCRDVKLHLTLINTWYHEPVIDLTKPHPPPKTGSKQIRQPFDARSVMAQHGEVDFGVHELTEMHLSQRQLLPGKYYTMLDVIDI